MEKELETLVSTFLKEGIIRFGAFRWKLHEKNPDVPLIPMYTNLRLLRSYPMIMRAAMEVYEHYINQSGRPDLLADVPTAATPIVSILMDRTGIPMISPRKDEKTHGIYTAIDGKFQGGQTVLLIDDVLSLADSKLEVIDILRRNNLIVERVLVFLDYEIGGEEKLKEVSCTLQAAIKIGKLLSFCLKEGTISRQQHEEITSTFQAVKTYFCK